MTSTMHSRRKNYFHVIFLLLCCVMGQVKTLFAQQERDFYRKDFYLNLNRPDGLQNDSKSTEQDWYEAEEEDDESLDKKTDQRDFYEDENQIVMSDDFFVVPPEYRKREDILFLYLLPGFMGLLTLALLWTYFRKWLRNKREAYRTRQRLVQIRQKFRGRETDAEFTAQLKETLKLPPGATTQEISRKMPIQDRELQQMLNKHDENFRKPKT
ncbi:MAG: hypothetical protein GX927_01305 [Lentisphaerae bacterium]|nr:hypothetical protein [Lentisphaerota bacterium]